MIKVNLHQTLKYMTLIFFTSLSSGCGFFYPKKVESYDTECQIVTKHLELQSVGINGVGISCQNEGCLIALIPAATSAIISGSIVLIGNVIYWLEEQGRCLISDTDP